MVFWIVAAGLALAVALVMALALVRGRRRAGESAGGASDMQVYRDQLAEVDRDLARGVIGAEEAERARLEVQRRILEADRAAGDGSGTGRAPRGASLVAAALSGVVVLGGSLGLYAWLGARGYPDLPIAERIADAEAARGARPGQAEMEAAVARQMPPKPEVDPQFAELMEKLRAVAAERPDDLQGQELLARNEARIGNYAAARIAQERVIALKGEAATALDYLDLADVMILAAGGYVSPEAEVALLQALRRDPANPVARYYAGLMFAQGGRPDRAFQFWKPLLEEGPPDAPWVAPIRERIEGLARDAGVRYSPPPAGPVAGGPGPSAEDIEAAGEMTAEERQAMIEGMVGRLAERLASEGGPPRDWARLIGALGVLGRNERAAAIWSEAQGIFADDPEGLALIRDAARNAGVAE